MKFTPKTEGFSGSIEIDLEPFRQRMKEGTRISQIEDAGEKFDALMDKVEAMVKKVDLVYESDEGKHEIKSFDELGNCQPGSEVINELMGIYGRGLPLGKPLGQK